MCGIALLSNRNHRHDESIIQRMTRSLHHRGPDSSGTEIVGCNDFFLGHTRLQVLDPVGGIQPMWDQTKRYCLVFNGEIFNFQSLRKELESLGQAFSTNSDTEVVLHSFRQWGKDCVEKLNGQFAFAVVDSEEKSIFAARDRMGENPLFFAKTDSGELILASELKAILSAQVIEPKLSLQAVDSFLKLSYIPPHQTIYRNVQTLRPGCTLFFQNGKLETKSYWVPKLATESIGHQEASKEVRRLLSESVKRQMVADTEVGAFLSGGLDSTTIVGLMNGCNSGSKIKTFAVGFGDLINELPFAKEVADHYQTEHHEIQMDIHVAQMLTDMVDVYDQPFGDSSNIPTFLVSQFASQHVKVVLSGDGGDELFGGYSWYQYLLDQLAVPASKSSMSKDWWISKLAIGSLRKKAKKRFREQQLLLQPNNLFDQHLARLSVQSDDHRSDIWNNGLPGRSTEEDLHSHFLPLGLNQTEPSGQRLPSIDQATQFDLRCYLPGDIFAKVDTASMANGLETRSPFMDVELLEFVLSLPARFRFTETGRVENNWEPSKWMLRSSCEDLWPDSIKKRSKQGFGAPIKNWLANPEVDRLWNRVSQNGSPLKFLFPELPSKSIEANNPLQAKWNLLCLGLWLEKHESCLNHLR